MVAAIATSPRVVSQRALRLGVQHGGRMVAQRRRLERIFPSTPPVAQLHTPAPALLFVIVDRKTEAVIAVTTDTHQPLVFTTVAPTSGVIAEGTVVLQIRGAKVAWARFATDAIDAARLPEMTKVKTEVKLGDAPPKIVAPAKRDLEIATKAPGEPRLKFANPGIPVFENVEKGEDHFKKHGAEFDATDAPDYVGRAKEFSKDNSNAYREVIVQNTFIRYDPKTNAVLIQNQREVKTLYVWDQKFSDPVLYAVYYTITSAMGIPIVKLEAGTLSAINDKIGNLATMEEEVIAIGLSEGKTADRVQGETLAAPWRVDGVIDRIMARYETDLEDGLSIRTVAASAGIIPEIVESYVERKPLLKMIMALAPPQGRYRAARSDSSSNEDDVM